MISRARFVNNIRLQHQQQVAVRLFATEASVKTTNTKSTFDIEYAKAAPFSSIPGPTLFTMIKDNIPGGKYSGLNINEVLRKLFDEYGNLVRIPPIFGKPGIVMTNNPENAEKVFRNEGPWPQRLGLEIIGYHRLKARPEQFGGHEGLLSSSGEQWGKFRSTVNPIMMKPKAAKLYVPKIDQVANDFLQRIHKIRDPATLQLPENFEDDLNRWALESIGVIAMDIRYGLISDKADERSAKFINAVKLFFDLIMDLELGLPLWRIFPTPSYRKMLKTLDTLAEISSEYIDSARKAIDSLPKEAKEDREESVLEKLLKTDPIIAKVMAMDMILAGVDTTSSALTSLLYLLAKNPEKQEILRQEVLTVLPEKNSIFTAEKMAHLPYLRACLKESLRLYPVVNGSGRFIVENLVFDGYQIPKGLFIGMSTHFMQTDETYYPQAEAFDPERWLKHGSGPDKCPAAAKQTNPFTYLPFGFGPRMCIGRRFAEMEIEILTSKILRNYRIKWEHPDLKFKLSTLNTPDGKLMFTFIDI